MSFVANNMIIRSMQEKLSRYLTANTMQTVLDDITDVISNYEITYSVVEDTENDIFVDTFLDALSVEGRSKKTIERYRYVLRRFLKEVGVNSRNVTQYHIRQYLSSEKSRGISDGTIKSCCWVFSSYFGWLHRDGIISKNPMGNIGTIKVQKKVKEIFSEVDIEKLKIGCKTVRDKAIICFLKSTGCRIGEVTGLNRDDIDFNNLECVVLGKGNKQRTVYMDAITGMVLQDYISSRKDDNPALFIGQRKTRFTPSGVRNMLKNTGRMTGVDHVHPHKFRRTEITELVNRGMPIEQVKTLAGHEKIDTTMGYVKIDQVNVKNSYRKYA